MFAVDQIMETPKKGGQSIEKPTDGDLLALEQTVTMICSAFNALGFEYDYECLDSLMDRALNMNLSPTQAAIFVQILEKALASVLFVLEKNRKRVQPILTIKDEEFNCDLCKKIIIGFDSVISERFVYCAYCYGYRGNEAEDALIPNDTIKITVNSLENLCGGWAQGDGFETDLVCTIIFETFRKCKAEYNGPWIFRPTQEKQLFVSRSQMRKAEQTYKDYEDEIKKATAFISKEEIDLQKLNNSQLESMFLMSPSERRGRKRHYSETKDQSKDEWDYETYDYYHQ